MEAGFAATAGLALGTLAGGDVRLITDDWIDAGVLAFLVELDGAVEIAVIGHGDGVHAQLLDAGDQLGNAVGAVEQAVVRVAMEMNETIGHGSSLSAAAGGCP